MNHVTRITNPEDALIKRQAAYAGDVKHKYYNLPGEYISPCVNEIPKADGTRLRVDSAYFILLDGEEMVMNHEDESSRVDEKTLKKIYDYAITLEYFFGLHSVSAISTTVPIEKCQTKYKPSPSITFEPIIKSCPEYDEWEKINIIVDKIENNESFLNEEALDLVMIPRMANGNHEKILETVCELLTKIKLLDEEFRLELVIEMRYMIHKYARTLKDISRLEEVIGLHERMTAREYQDRLLIEKGRNEGRDEGRREGRNEGRDDGLMILDLLGRFSPEDVSRRLDIPLSTVLKFKRFV